MKVNAIFLLIIVAVLKSIFSYLLMKYNIDNLNNLLLSLAQFGAIIGVFLTLLYFILLSYLTYIISTLISMELEVSFIEILNKWYPIGLTPMILSSIYFVFNYRNISTNIDFISYANTISEVFFFIYGTYVLFKELKINIIYSLFSIFTPVLLFNLFKNAI